MICLFLRVIIIFGISFEYCAKKEVYIMMKILIAEDDTELCRLFSRVLTQNGYVVKGVSNGIELTCELELCGVDTSDVDIIVTDDTRMYLDTGTKIVDGKITLSPWSCTEIRFSK